MAEFTPHLSRVGKGPSHDLPTVNNRILTCDMAGGNSGTKTMSKKTNNAPKKLTPIERLALFVAELGTSAKAAEDAAAVKAKAEGKFVQAESAYKAAKEIVKGIRKESGQSERTFSGNVRKAYKDTKAKATGKETKKMFRAVVEDAAPSQLGTFDNVWSEQVAKDRAALTGDTTDTTETRGQGNKEVKASVAESLVQLEKGDGAAAMREINTTVKDAIESTWGKDKDGNVLPASIMENKSSMDYSSMIGRTYKAIETSTRAVSVAAAKVSKNAFAIADTSDKAELTDEEKAEIAANAASQAKIDKAAKGKGRNRKAATLKNGALA